MIKQYGRRSMRRKPWYRSARISQLVTFILGMVVGACLYYALSDVLASRAPGEDTPLAVEDASTGTVETPAQQEAEVSPRIEIEQAIEPVPADMQSLWPLRHVIIGVDGVQLSRVNIDMLNSWKPGGVWLRESNTENPRQIEEMISLINLYASLDGTRAQNPLVCMIQEGGPGKDPLRLGNALSYQELASLESLEAIRDRGRQVARAALDRGVGVLLAPRLDIFFPGKTAAEERFGYLSDNKESVIQAGLAYAGGLMEGGALSVVGNYPGMGSAVHRELRVPVVEETDIERLAEIMLPFAEVAASDISGILVGGVSVPALDKERPDRPASLSPRLVREVLRRQFGYTGVVLASDILDVAVWSGNEPEEDIVDALKAGCDAVFISSVNGEQLGRIAQEIAAAVDRGILEKEELDASARRLDLWRQHIAQRYPEPPEESVMEEGEEEDPVIEEPEEVEELEEETAETEATEPVEEEVEVEEVTVEEAVEEKPEEASVEAEAVEETVTEETEVSSEEIPAEEEIPEEVEAVEEEAVAEETVDAAEEVFEEEEAEQAPKVVETPRTPAPQPTGTQAISYTIQPGDSLSKIAKNHQVTANQLMQWNALPNGDIKFGRKLTIYVTDLPQEEKAEEPEAVEEAEEPAALSEEEPPEEPAEAVAEEEAVIEESVTEEADEPAEVVEEEVQEESEEAAVEKSDAPAEELPPPLEPSRETENLEEETVIPEEVDGSIEPENDMDYQPAAEVLEEAEEVAQAAPEEEADDEAVEETVEDDGEDDTSDGAAESDPEEEAAPVSETSESPAEEFTTHTIDTGDTLHSIAKRYNTTVQHLIKINEIKDANVIVLGKEIKVPLP